MIHARHYSLVYGGHYGSGKVACVGGSAYLVEYNPKLRLLFPKA